MISLDGTLILDQFVNHKRTNSIGNLKCFESKRRYKCKNKKLKKALIPNTRKRIIKTKNAMTIRVTVKIKIHKDTIIQSR